MDWITLATGFLGGAAATAAICLLIRKSPQPAAAPIATSDATVVPDPTANDEDDTITAPIMPFVEFGRSPHERHRDLTIAKALIKRLDMLDSIIQNCAKKGDDDTEKQLLLLRSELLALLAECSVEDFDYKEGTVVDSIVRKRILVIEGSPQGERTLIARTIRGGFLYRDADEDPVVLRKAEVAIS